MATPISSANSAGTPPPREPNVDFTSRLRFEFADPEARALVWSYAISAGLAIVWLIMVGTYKIQHQPSLLPENEQVTINLLDSVPPPTQPASVPSGEETKTASPTPTPTRTAEVARTGPRNAPPGRKGPTGNPRAGRPGSRTEQTSTGAIGDAFGTGSGSGTGGLAGDVSGILRDVSVASGTGGSGGGVGGRGGGGAGGKAVIGYGQGGEGGNRPGRGGFGGGSGTGGGGGGGGIGGVGSGGGGGGIAKATVRVAPPRAVESENLGGPSRDVGELGAFVRSRESQLRFCYVEYGLKQNPSLAGTVNVAISLAGSGSVTGVDITSRTWGGAGASEAESCIRSKIRGWKFPSSAAGGGTYSFPFNFTR